METPNWIWAALSAGMGIVFTQWLIFRRELTKMLLDKLEQLTVQVELARDDSRLAIETWVEKRAVGITSAMTMESLKIDSRITTLISFYFPQLSKDGERILMSRHNLNVAVQSASSTSYQEHIRPQFSAAWDEATDLIRKIALDHPTLSRRIIPQIRAWADRQASGM